MATLLNSESRRRYSWWWDSHISPKNSKWLQENLTDMDAKVKSMIKLIEEDADSFARRAEMYYKKRPELMKLVEEFYRAYRALAERYDHATVELRQAHRTMAEAFPNQIPYALSDDSPSSSSVSESEPHTPEGLHPIRALLEPDDLKKDVLGLSSANLNSMYNSGPYFEESNSRSKKKGLKQLNDIFQSTEAASEGSKKAGDKKRGPNPHEAGEIQSRDDREILALGKTLSEIEAEKDSILLQYEQSLQKLSSLEKELMDFRGLEEQLGKAESEVQALREVLLKLEAERDAGLLEYKKCLEKISFLENMILQMQQDAKQLQERASRAEMEAKNLKQYHSKLEAEKEADLLQYNQCLEMISVLENKILTAEKNARAFSEQASRAETEVENLKQDVHKLNEEKAAAELRYEQCLEKISSMQKEMFRAQEDAKRLNDEMLMVVSKLNAAEEKCSVLERSNKTLQLEADNLAHKIAVKDQELLEKGNQLEKLQTSLKDEHSRLVEIEATFQALQKLHSQSQEEQVALSKELQNRLQMLKDLETCNHDLQKDLLQAKVENRSLNELNSSSILSISNLQKENICLMEMKAKLEEKVSLQVSQSNVLHQEIHHLKNEIEGLSIRYQALVEQVNSVGLDPECIASSIKELQSENSQLKDAFRNDKDEKEILLDKLRNMDKLLEKNVALESSMSELKAKLEGSGVRIDELQETCQILRGEKSELNAEKAVLLSQLQTMTESVQKLLEQNALLDNSLCSARVELEGLRSKSKSLEDMCQMLKDEKSDLLTEKNNLVTELKDVEERLGNLEIRFARLEEKYTELEKEKEFSRSSVQELWSYLGVEKQAHANYVQSSNSRFVNLENELRALHQERKLSKKEFEEELDKAVNAQLEIFILQKFVQDLEDKNLSLLFECQRHVEASKLSNKLMSELETENLEQQVELEFLLDETEKLKIGLDQIFRALEFDLDNEDEHASNKQFSASPILDGIEDLKTSLLKNEDEKQKLVFENLVHLTFLGQLELEGHEVRSEKKILEQDIEIMNERYEVLEKAKRELEQMNKKLSLEIEMAKKQEEVLGAELEMQHDNLLNMQALVCALQEKSSREVAGNELLLQKCLDLEGKLNLLEEDYCHYAQESVAMTVRSIVLQGFGIEKVEEIKTLSDNLSCVNVINRDLNKKIQSLGEKMDAKDIESFHLNEAIEKLKKEADDGKDLVYQLYFQISIGNILLRQKAEELFQAEQELKAMYKQNEELCRTTEKLKRECEESKITQDHLKRKIVELSEDLTSQDEEIACLNSENDKLESLVGILSKEVEERRIREENLSLELQERSYDFELWEAEASSFYFDLQISSVREVLLENKVHELAKVCESLEEEKGTKDIEIESMRERFGLLENEIGGLKAQLSEYVPVIAALRDDIETLQDNTLQRRKQYSSKNQRPKAVNIASQSHEMHRDEHKEDTDAPALDGISALLKMRSTIKAIEKNMVEEMNRLAPEKPVVEDFHRLKMQKDTHSNVRKGSQRYIAEFLSQENEFPSEDIAENSKPRISESRNGVMKDIPLDEGSDSSSHCKVNKRSTSTDDPMLELWEFSEKDCCIDLGTNETTRPVTAPPRIVVQRDRLKAKHKNSNPSMESHVEKEVGIDKLQVPMSMYRGANDESSKGKVLERLASDAKKLASLQKTLQDIKMRLDVKKQGKKVDYLEFERLKTQLQHVEEAVMELVDTNDRLTNGIQEGDISSEANTSAGSVQAVSVYRNMTFEQAHEGSEKIKSLQLELQGIWSAVLKLEAEKKNKGNYRFPGSRTGILLKNFIHSRSSRRRKKPRFCGCARPSANED